MDHDIVLNDVIERLNKLGLQCKTVPTHKLSSATTALACFPMYMVANVATWSDDSDRHLKLSNLFNAASLRDAYAIGEQETRLEINAQHAAPRSCTTCSRMPGHRCSSFTNTHWKHCEYSCRSPTPTSSNSSRWQSPA